MTKEKITVLILICALSIGNSFASVTVFDNLNSPAIIQLAASYTIKHANKITPTANIYITDITVSVSEFSQNQSFVVKVCPDNAGQVSTNCQFFTQQTTPIPLSPNYGNILFTGTFSSIENSPFWVVLEAQSQAGYFGVYANSNIIPGVGYEVSTSTPILLGNDESMMMSVIGTPAPAPSAVPTLSEWSQMLLGLLVMTMIGWHFHKQRSY